MYDIVTLGSGTVDVFVRANAEIVKHKDHTDIAFSLGKKILIQNLVNSTGGGGTNTAVAFARLGLKTGWIGKLGDEENAKQVAEVIDKEKVKFLGNFGTGTTGYSVILYGEGHDRSLLTYKGINNKLSLRDIKKFNTKAMYISTMMGDGFKTAEAVLKKYKKKNY